MNIAYGIVWQHVGCVCYEQHKRANGYTCQAPANNQLNKRRGSTDAALASNIETPHDAKVPDPKRKKVLL